MTESKSMTVEQVVREVMADEHADESVSVSAGAELVCAEGESGPQAQSLEDLEQLIGIDLAFRSALRAVGRDPPR